MDSLKTNDRFTRRPALASLVKANLTPLPEHTLGTVKWTDLDSTDLLAVLDLLEQATLLEEGKRSAVYERIKFFVEEGIA